MLAPAPDTTSDDTSNVIAVVDHDDDDDMPAKSGVAGEIPMPNDAVDASITSQDSNNKPLAVEGKETPSETGVLEIYVDDDIDLILPSSDSENEAQLPSEPANDACRISNEENAHAHSGSDGSDSDTSDSDSDDSDDAQSVSDIKEMLNDEDEDAISGPIVSTNEVIDEAAPTLPQGYCIPEDAPIELVGTVTGLVEQSMIIKGNSSGEYRVLDEELVLCTADRKPVGLLFETFGRLLLPFYRVKFATTTDFEQFKDTKGSQIYSVVPDSKFIITDTIRIKGCDASNVHDEELAEHEREFSDDEDERLAKRDRKLKRKSKKTTHDDSGSTAPLAVNLAGSKPMSKYPPASYGVASPSVPTYVPRSAGAANSRGTRAPLPDKPVFDSPSQYHLPPQLPVSLAHSQMLDFEQQQHRNSQLQNFNTQPAQAGYNSQPAQASYNSQATPNYISQPTQPKYNSQPTQTTYNPQPSQSLYGGQNAFHGYVPPSSQSYQSYQPSNTPQTSSMTPAAQNMYGAHSPYGVPFNTAQQYSSNALHHQYVLPQQPPTLNNPDQFQNHAHAPQSDAPKPLDQDQLAELQRLVLKKLDQSEQSQTQ